MPDAGTQNGFFHNAWRQLTSVRERMRERKERLPKRLAGGAADPQAVLDNAQKKLDFWTRVDGLAAHREALESVMQQEVVTSVNRLFSPAALPHEISFDRGVLYFFLILSDKLSRSGAEAVKARTELNQAEQELKFAVYEKH